jgi:hypothetical protein
MADETNTDTKNAPKATDFIAKIGGNLHFANAAEIFGKDKAIAALKAFATAGGHGLFEDAELNSPLFGGFATPDDAATQAKINAALAEVK